MFLNNIWDGVTKIAEARKLMERTCFALADASIGIKVRNSTYRKQVDISNESASKDLRALVEARLLVPKGERKGRYYEASDEIAQLARSAYVPKKERDPFALVQEKKAQEAQPDLPGIAP